MTKARLYGNANAECTMSQPVLTPAGVSVFGQDTVPLSARALETGYL
jgi:hypothetical protein